MPVYCTTCYFKVCKGRRGGACIYLHLPMQSVHITTNVVSSNPSQVGVLATTLCDKVCK